MLTNPFQVAHAFKHQLPVTLPFADPIDEQVFRRIGFKPVQFLDEIVNQSSLFDSKFTTHQVHGLDAIGSLINGTDFLIPGILFQRKIPGESDTAKNLDPGTGNLKSLIRSKSLADRNM